MFVWVTEPHFGLYTPPTLYFRPFCALLGFAPVRQSKKQLLRTCGFGFSLQILSFSAERDPSAVGNAEIELKCFRNLRRVRTWGESVLPLTLYVLKKGKKPI